MYIHVGRWVEGQVRLARTVRTLTLKALADASEDKCASLQALEIPQGCLPADVAHGVLRTLMELTFPAHAGCTSTEVREGLQEDFASLAGICVVVYCHRIWVVVLFPVRL